MLQMTTVAINFQLPEIPSESESGYILAFKTIVIDRKWKRKAYVDQIWLVATVVRLPQAG